MESSYRECQTEFQRRNRETASPGDSQEVPTQGERYNPHVFESFSALYSFIDGQGARHNDDKSRIDLICPLFLVSVGDVLRYGAAKYAERNWERGNNWSVPMASLLRHYCAFQQGEDIDPESGLPHTGHMGFNVMQLHRNYMTYPEGDDRSRALKEQTNAY